MLPEPSALLVFAIGATSDRIVLSPSILTPPLVFLAVFFVGSGLGFVMKAPIPTVLPLYDTKRNIPRPYQIVPAYYAYGGNTRPPKRGCGEQALTSTNPARNLAPCKLNTYRQVATAVQMPHGG